MDTEMSRQPATVHANTPPAVPGTTSTQYGSSSPRQTQQYNRDLNRTPQQSTLNHTKTSGVPHQTQQQQNLAQHR